MWAEYRVRNMNDTMSEYSSLAEKENNRKNNRESHLEQANPTRKRIL